jgi:hypothetical protein
VRRPGVYRPRRSRTPRRDDRSADARLTPWVAHAGMTRTFNRISCCCGGQAISQLGNQAFRRGHLPDARGHRPASWWG